jgi:rubredoxin
MELSDFPVGFHCAECGYEFLQTLGWLEANDHFVCPQPGCEERNDFDANQLRNARAGLKALREALERLAG